MSRRARQAKPNTPGASLPCVTFEVKQGGSPLPCVTSEVKQGGSTLPRVTSEVKHERFTPAYAGSALKR